MAGSKLKAEHKWVEKGRGKEQKLNCHEITT